MNKHVTIGDYQIGLDFPPFLVAEIGINHNGSLDSAVEMVHLAKMSGANAVKFQKRTPRICVPEDQWEKSRETPWGAMPYINYKEKLEFNGREYDTISHVCKEAGLLWFASVWDIPSLEFIETYKPPCYKVGSASLTDGPLLDAVKAKGRPIVLSTGMSTMEEIEEALERLEGASDLILCHSTSIYPCPKEKLNLRFLSTMHQRWPDMVIGYSGHEQASRITQVAVGLGAAYIERHFTLDRRGWGTDQAASLEHWQFKDMADRIHETWTALGDGIKVVYPEEQEKKVTLRKEPVA